MNKGVLAALIGVCVFTALGGQCFAKTWRMAETQNFRIYATDKQKDLREFAASLEDFHAVLTSITNFNADVPPAKFDLYLVKDSKDLRSYTTLSKNAAGYYTATPTGTAAFSERTRVKSADTSKSFQLTSQQILFHEYAHHFMLRYFPSAYPPWFVEGFAEYVSTAQITDKEIIIGDFSGGRAYWLGNGKWLPAEILLSPLAQDLTKTQNAKFYAQSWLLAHYLLRSGERSRQLKDYLAQTPTKDTLEAQFQGAFGQDFKALYKSLRRYLKGRGEKMTYSRYTRKRPRDVAMTMSTLPASADDILIMSAKLDIGINPEFRASFIEDVDAVRKKNGDDYMTLRTWAYAHALFGKRDDARALLMTLAEQRGDDVKARFYLGMTYFLEAFEAASDGADPADYFKRAKGHFARAYKLDSTHYPTLYYYYHSLPKPTTQMKERTLEQAELLAPQVEQIRYDLAVLWSGRDDEAFKSAAKRLFGILASDPHRGSVSQLASARLKEMQAPR